MPVSLYNSFKKLKYVLYIIIFILPSLLRGQDMGKFTFAVPGAKWYYANKGYDEEHIKHILVKMERDTLIPDTATKQYDTAQLLVFYYLDKDSVVKDMDSLIVKETGGGFMVPNVQYYHKDFSGQHYWVYLYIFMYPQSYVTLPFADHIFTPPSQVLDTISCAKVNGFTLKYATVRLPWDTSNPKQDPNFCNRYEYGNIIERVGSTFYMFIADTCKKEQYGGPLLWYYDTEFGLYEQGKTQVVKCNDSSNTAINPFVHSEKSAIKIYPNPCNTHIIVKGLDKKMQSLYVTDVLGHSIIEQSVAGHEEVQINTENWKRGFYILRFYNGKLWQNIKLLKE